ncbi:MAG: hypothetical protein K9W46_07335 [Candidatus Heimdallarchaeum endolithica]|uniref:Uncharacterized protein n=1 Tax=Candidatus Heimdallarchaeum endolithica TaxID=2876572 RepID=A0A9Y1BNF0_9ARCH|nr:MAG: hypothetical protein K9W46_07335 [Candidatus Heimdallarchaeum endolithica]
MDEIVDNIKKAASIKLKGLSDIIKLIASTLTDRMTGYIGYFYEKEENKNIFFMFNTSLGYYNLRALPIVVWIESDKPPAGSFIRYRTSPKEEFEFADEVSDARWPVSIPIVNFEEMPEFLKVWKEEKSKQ